MIGSGNATVMVSDMERAVRFYTETLGLKLRVRFGDEWAEVETTGLIIGLHAEGHGPKPGSAGAISLGFNLDGSITAARAALEKRGVRFHGPTTENPPVKLAHFADPDGNPLYLCETMR